MATILTVAMRRTYLKNTGMIMMHRKAFRCMNTLMITATMNRVNITNTMAMNMIMATKVHTSMHMTRIKRMTICIKNPTLTTHQKLLAPP